MLDLLLANFPSSSALSSARSSLSLYLLNYPTPLFLHPLSLSPSHSPSLCTLERLALIKLIAMVIHLNGFPSRCSGAGGDRDHTVTA